MTLFLASVRDLAEAEIALGAGADIIDLKDPGRGSLGAVHSEIIGRCRTALAGRATLSATIGDLPMQAAHMPSIRQAVLKTAALGVDYVKVGVFPGEDARACLGTLKDTASQTRLILVLFADAMPDFDAIAAAAGIGACGVMLDTAAKGAGALLDHMCVRDVARIVDAAQKEGLTVGVAGSLRAGHVASLLALRPDLMGFRGALCRGGVRNETIDAIACGRIRALIPRVEREVHEHQLQTAPLC